jgi:U3 small nucleolar RNA-associated protein 21
MKHAKTLAPSSLDFELRSLDLSQGCDRLLMLLEGICKMMKTNKDFELLQSYLFATLKIHNDIILANRETFDAILNQLAEQVQDSWGRVDTLFQKSLCMVDFIRSVE